MDLQISPFLQSEKWSVDLNSFEPKDSYECFLKEFCIYLQAEFIRWHQGFESGIGQIIYRGDKIDILWSDFPFSLSFDCSDKTMAKNIQKNLEVFFEMDRVRWASAWKDY